VSPNISLTTTPPVEAEPTRAPEPPPTPWAGVLGAATQFAASLAVAKSKPLDGEAMAALGAASAVLLMAWQRAMGEACAASSATSTAAAQLQWEDLQREAGRLAEAFATSIAAYNAAVTQFPAALLAWLFGFREARALAITAP
jgi:LemA protein